jgi:hypothetical protein
MRFLVSAAESEYINTVDIHIPTCGGNAIVGYYPIRRTSYLAQRLQEYPYDNLVPFGNSHDFWAFRVECISHALHFKDSGDSKQAYYYLCLAGIMFNGLLIDIDKLIPMMLVLCDHACKICKVLMQREHPLPIKAQEYLHLTLFLF